MEPDLRQLFYQLSDVVSDLNERLDRLEDASQPIVGISEAIHGEELQFQEFTTLSSPRHPIDYCGLAKLIDIWRTLSTRDKETLEKWMEQAR